MKTLIYLKVAKTARKIKVAACERAEYTPLYANIAGVKRYFPTVLIALNLEIPDSEFENTRLLLNAKIEKAVPALQIEQITLEK